MKADLLPRLQCPFTGSALTIAASYRERNGDIVCGTVRSAAGEFPIIDGVLRLLADELREPIVGALRAGDETRARRLAIDWPYVDRWTGALGLTLSAAARARAYGVLKRMAGLKRRLDRMLVKDAPFCELVDRMRPGAWAEWQKFRLSMSSFLPAYALLPLVRADGFVLDFGCGLGHSSFLLARVVPRDRLICVDRSFTALCLARRYFAPGATAISLDGNLPLPFTDRVFATIFAADALHFVTAKRTLVQEFARTLAARGVVIGAHVHNALAPIASGSAVSPQALVSMFAEGGLDWRLVPDVELVEAFRSNGPVDLVSPRDDAAVDRAFDGFSVVASRAREVFKRYENIAAAFVARVDRPRLNPIYRVKRNGAQWRLDKSVSPEYVERVQSRMPDYLHDDYRLNFDEIVDGQVTAASSERLSALMRRFVVIDMPEHYV